MFSKERNELKKLSLDFKFNNYETLIQQRKSLESAIADASGKLDELEKRAKEYAAMTGKEYDRVYENRVNVRKRFQLIKDWRNEYAACVGLKKSKPTIFDAAAEKKIKELAEYDQRFANSLLDEMDFTKAVTFVEGFNAIGKLTEDNAKKKNAFVEKFSISTYAKITQFLSKEIRDEVAKAEEMANTITKTEQFYSDVESYLSYWDFLAVEKPYYSDSTLRAFSDLRSGIDRGEGLIEEFAEIKGDGKLKIFAKFDSEYKKKINDTIKEIRLALNKANEAAAERRKHRKSRTVIYGIAFGLLMALFAAVAIVTVVRTIIDFSADIPVFWAILFGLIVGLLFAVIRLVVLMGMGSLWWPECVATLILPEASSEISMLVVILNAVFLLIALFYFFFALYRADVDGTGFVTDFTEASIGFVTIVILGLLVRIVWSGIEGLVVIWNIWEPIEVLCGLGLGLFRLVMLIFGAGFWWPELFSCTFVDGLVLNVCFYAVIAGAITYAVITQRLEEKHF